MCTVCAIVSTSPVLFFYIVLVLGNIKSSLKICQNSYLKHVLRYEKYLAKRRLPQTSSSSHWQLVMPQPHCMGSSPEWGENFTGEGFPDDRKLMVKPSHLPSPIIRFNTYKTTKPFLNFNFDYKIIQNFIQFELILTLLTQHLHVHSYITC